jgi:Family of unknown function (DUF5670)
MLWTIFVVLVILWLLGFGLHVGGSLIHLLLVLGLVVLVINLLSGRRAWFMERHCRQHQEVPVQPSPSWRRLHPESGAFQPQCAVSAWRSLSGIAE